MKGLKRPWVLHWLNSVGSTREESSNSFHLCRTLNQVSISYLDLTLTTVVIANEYGIL